MQTVCKQLYWGKPISCLLATESKVVTIQLQ